MARRWRSGMGDELATTDNTLAEEIEILTEDKVQML